MMMLSSIFDSARRSFRQRPRRASSHSRYDSLSRVSRFTGRSQNNFWPSYDRNVDEDDDDDADDARDFTEGNGEDERALDHEDHDLDEDDEQDQESEDAPLLPIFEASQLDSLPVYSLTHAIRLLITTKCETTLSWDQLRSPQVSQFLVKPIQKEILDSHFSKATVYALIANCLQFSKEADLNPAIVGMSRSRAMVCELLAIRLLREYSIRELIDVLSYDFYPLQGMPEPSDHIQARKRPQAARTSTLEVAIRASAKRFLAHPMVVQQLEAIWAGTIVFHHAADAAHRTPKQLPRLRQYGTMQSGTTSGLLSDGGRGNGSGEDGFSAAVAHLATRRTVTLYDPKQASLFKLSRLRVPRYRHFLSTCSLAVFLGLFLAVLTERSIQITTLEVVFWFWSAGFMLDEVVGFNEQGFSMYIMSIWNAFDLGILLLLVCFYALRLYSVLLLGGHKQWISDLAFDFLAANAILLFPRLFSILDHYRYFSQLLIAFRMMAQDLVAVFILIAISCSGFFVAFTLSFGNELQNPGKTAYELYQMLMGFTPTAWELWEQYNALGRSILVLFMLITHFLVVTILVTVLTNSFTAIVQNANDEHQFVFAVNTISMVKSDALFSYIAPSNFLGWLLTPLRYFLPFRTFVWLNRTVIKVTHLPVLSAIFAYERVILRNTAYDPIEEAPERGRRSRKTTSFDPVGSGMMIFSPREPKLREPSAATFYKDRALAEVFRQPYSNTFRKNEKDRKKRAVVDNWMLNMGPDAEVSPPDEQDSDIVDRLERPRLSLRSATSRRLTSGMSLATRSLAASDPEDFITNDMTASKSQFLQPPAQRLGNFAVHSDHDGDDEHEILSNDDTERITNDGRDSLQEKENVSLTPKQATMQRPRPPLRSLTSSNILPARSNEPYRAGSISFADWSPGRHTPAIRRLSATRPTTSRRITTHQRNASIQTVLFNPTDDEQSDAPPVAIKKMDDSTADEAAVSPLTDRNIKSINQRKIRNGQKSSARTPPRPAMPARVTMLSSPNVMTRLPRIKDSSSVFSHSPPASSAPGSRYNNNDNNIGTGFQRNTTMGLDLASDLGDNKAAGPVAGNVGVVPASFATQLAFADRLRRMRSEERHDDDRRMNKLMLARMGVLEQGFREVLKEVKEMRESDRKKKKIRAAIASSTGSSTTALGISTPRRASRAHVMASAVESDEGPMSGALNGEPASPGQGEWIDEPSPAAGGERGSSI